MRLLGRDTGAFAVADLFAGGKGRGFTGQGDAQRLFGSDGPGVKQVQIGVAVGHVLRVGQAGHRVLGGEAGDVVGGLHRLADRVGGEVGGGGVAALLSQVDGHAERLVAVALHVLQLALAHRHAQARALGHLGRRIDRAQLPGVAERQVHQVFELAPRVLETRQRGSPIGRGGGAGNGCGDWGRGIGSFFHVDGYDTCRSPFCSLTHPLSRNARGTAVLASADPPFVKPRADRSWRPLRGEAAGGAGDSYQHVPQTHQRLFRPWPVRRRRQ
jgi:hypothetical protein